MKVIEMKEKLPFTLIHATEAEIFAEMEGYYDEKSQTWKGVDILLSTTHCRTSSTGILGYDDDSETDDDR